jgi:endonuclease G, mitochondrial
MTPMWVAGTNRVGAQMGPQIRRDVVASTDENLSEALSAKLKDLALSPDRRPQSREDPERLAIRAAFVEPPESDPHGHERIIGESDLTSINYLDRGRRAATAVCRIRAPADSGEWYGTGFLVGPRLLVTNHHVLGNADEASQAEAEFGYEHDIDGVLREPVQFNLRPHEIFFTDPVLDVTFVAVAPLSDSGVPIDRYGWLQLLPPSGKGVDKEWVTIIQHPNGGPKQISIRSNRIVRLPEGVVAESVREHFIHYVTDTEPGSSGAPVLNDQWQVIAVHHKAVPAPVGNKKKKLNEPTKFVGNEGIRVSSIYHALEEQRFENTHAGHVLGRLEEGLGLVPVLKTTRASAEDLFERDARPFAVTRWKKAAGIGYDPDFLSVKIDLRPIYARAKADGRVAPLLKGGGNELAYHRFSVVIDAERKFALLTAVNIDGKMLKHPGDRPSAWRIDDRMDEKYQLAGNFYEERVAKEKVYFSRGHLVRRFDPSWGKSVKEAQLGDQDTFHYANAAPQFQAYNNVDWGDLEDYILDRAQTHEKRMTIFQGPVFRKNDPQYGREREGGPWRIPLTFWKIAVLQKQSDTVVAAAFMNGQTQYVKALYEAKVFKALSPYTIQELRSNKIQTTIETIEEETGLDFSAIRPFDAQGSLESTRRTRTITGPGDIII